MAKQKDILVLMREAAQRHHARAAELSCEGNPQVVAIREKATVTAETLDAVIAALEGNVIELRLLATDA